MSFETKDKAASVAVKKRVRIGSRVPEDNRAWLQNNGIVAELVTETLYPPVSASPKRRFKFKIAPPFWIWRTAALMALVTLAGALALGWFQDHHIAQEQFEWHTSRQKSLESSNHYLRSAVTQLQSVNTVQKSEIGRLTDQIQEMSKRFLFQLQDFQKGEAMSDALGHAFEGELERMSYRYDVEIENLRNQVADQDQIITSLEYSLQATDGVLVRADPISEAGMTNGSIAAVNTDFQFVIIDIGAQKGAQTGQTVELYHAGRLAGYGQVEKVYPEFSGIKVFSSDVLSRLEKGDAVFLKTTSVS